MLAESSQATLEPMKASQQYDRQAGRGVSRQPEEIMIDIASRKPVMVFKVLDRDGQPIGEVVQPKVAPVVGGGPKRCCWCEGIVQRRRAV